MTLSYMRGTVISNLALLACFVFMGLRPFHWHLTARLFLINTSILYIDSFSVKAKNTASGSEVFFYRSFLEQIDGVLKVLLRSFLNSAGFHSSFYKLTIVGSFVSFSFPTLSNTRSFLACDGVFLP